MRKCLLYVLSFVLFSTGLSIGFSGSASAWGENGQYEIEYCEDTLPFSINSEYINDEVENDFDNRGYDFTSVPEHPYLIGCNPPSGGWPEPTWVLVVAQDNEYAAYWDYKASNDRYSLYFGGNHMVYYIDGTGEVIFNTRYTSAIEYTLNRSSGSLAIAFHSTNVTLQSPAFEGAGGVTPDNVSGSGDKSYKPNITWTVDDYDVTFYSDHSKNTATLPPDYQIYWFFSNTTFDTVQPSEPFAVSGCTDPAFVNEHTVPVYFDYGLQAYYADRDCNILSRDLNDNVLIDQMVVLNVDGGTYSGSTETDSEYIEENKLVGAIKNISVDQHGLQSLVLAPAQLFAQVATWDGSCSTISMPFIQGKTLELQCIRSGFSTQYPVIYGTIQVVFGGLIAYFVAIRTFAVIKGANDPEDDKVETYKL